MTSKPTRLLSAALALLLALAAPVTALAAELPTEAPGDTPAAAEPLDITVPQYTPGANTGAVENIQKGELYTLVVLPQSGVNAAQAPDTLTLLTSVDALFIGSAVASDNGKVTFTDIHLRTSEASVYYVLGPGLDTPLMEASSASVAVQGTVYRSGGGNQYLVPNARVSLVDTDTGYAYANSTAVNSTSFYMDNISPGNYKVRVTTPGYLTYTSANEYHIDDDATHFLKDPIDLAPYLGDVNGDEVRDVTDLVDLLTCYQNPTLTKIPAGLTPDLSGDGLVNDADVALYISAAIGAGLFSPGVGLPAAVEAAQPFLAFRDNGAATQSQRSLVLSLNNGGVSGLTFTAATVTLSFRNDLIQPLNANGGAVYTGNPASAANCLQAAKGVTISNAAWTTQGNVVTLTFSLSCQKPTTLTNLVEFRYRPYTNRTVDDFFPGVFSVPHLAAQVGLASVLTGCDLEYPNSTPLELDSISIDLPAQTIDIPSAGRTVTRVLSATGAKGTATLKDLSGVTWTLEGQPQGVSISDGLLVIGHQAQPGPLTLTAQLGDHTDSVTLTLQSAEPQPQTIRILYDGAAGNSFAVTLPAGEAGTLPFQCEVLDQYNNVMAGQTVTWSASGVPGVTVGSGGVVTVSADLPAGTSTFSLHAVAGSARSSADVTLTLEAVVNSLMLFGDATAKIPSNYTNRAIPYRLSALDVQGRPLSVSLDPEFTLVSAILDDSGDGEGEGGSGGSGASASLGVSTAVDSITGALTVIVTPNAKPGKYILRASAGGISAPDFTLTLQPGEVASTTLPVSSTFLLGEQQGSAFTVSVTDPDFSSPSFDVYGRLLNEAGLILTISDVSWTFAASGLPQGITAQEFDTKDHIKIDFSGLTEPGTYFFTIVATETKTGLSATASVTLEYAKTVAKLDLNAPKTLEIPSVGSVRYTFQADALSETGSKLPLPGDLTWLVSETAHSGDKWTPSVPNGVTLTGNTLTVSSAAKPGTIYIIVRAADRYLAEVPISLTVPASDKVLALRRDGQLFTEGVDAIYGKEGTALSLSYTPVFVTSSTGKVEELTSEELKNNFSWRLSSGSFSVDAGVEPGTYTGTVSATYKDQSVSITSQITVYPNISSLYIDFDEGDADSAANRYSFAVPSRAAKTYYGTVMAQLTRGGKTVYQPLAALGLADYDLDIYSPMTGIYTAYDKATGRLALTIEPLASSNSMKDPDRSKGEAEIRRMYFDFSYYPGEELEIPEQVFMLTRESPSPVNAILRQGTGVGAKFVFETTRGESTLQVAPGVLSDCFGLELVDQYGDAVTNQYVFWSLIGAPQGEGGEDLVTFLDPGTAVSTAYPRYQSLRRLRISPDLAEGTYRFTLTAACGPTEAAAKQDPTFSRSVDIVLELSAHLDFQTVTLTGDSMALIPRWYSDFNSSAVNTETRKLSYVVAAQDSAGNEIDTSFCSYAWQVLDASGSRPTGVSIAANSDNPASATVTVTRQAQPTEADHPLRVVVTISSKTGSSTGSAEALLTLNRGSRVPILMTINGPTQYKLELTDSAVTQLYTFKLVDQYNQNVTSRDASEVTWRWNENLPNYVTVNKATSGGNPAVRVTVNNPGTDTRTTLTLTASIRFAEATSPTGYATVYQTLNIPITIGNPATIIGGGGLGGEIVEEPVITTSTVTPATSKSGTTGTSTLSAEEADTLSKTTATGTLTIAPKNTSGLTSITVTFPASVAKDIAAKNPAQSLRIQTAIGTVTLSRQALSSLNKGSGSISVTIQNQGNTLGVTFRSAGTALKAVSGTITLQAPVTGETVTAVTEDYNSSVLQKAVVSNGTLSATIYGSIEITLGAKGKVFSDTQNHWAKEAVEFVTSRGLFQGTSETTFSPNGDMTRGMVVTVLHRLENTPATTAANLFRDVPNGTWYTEAVTWANAQGIVQGNGDGFLPNDSVTREQLATILYRYMSTLGHSTASRASLSSFSDSANVSTWAQEAMEWAVSTGLITGKGGGILDPGGKASRAEVATMLERLITNLLPSA